MSHQLKQGRWKLKREKLLFLLILLLGLNNWMLGVNFITYRIEAVETVSSQYLNHDPISIYGNADFISQATAENWPGDGSVSNPFIIGGMSINGNNHAQLPSYLIVIRNANLHFQIRNNLLVGANESGILLLNVTNAVITENSISLSKWHGIAIGGDSEYILVFNNSIFSNERAGIGLWESKECDISSNVVYNNSYSIYVQDSDTSFFVNNTIFNSDVCGISLGFSNNNLLKNNTVYDCVYDGIYLWDSSDNDITNNTSHDNGGYGIEISSSSNDNDIADNIIFRNRDYGLYITSSENTLIERNDFSENKLGGDSQAYDDNRSNLFYNNYWSDHTSPDSDGNGIVDEPYSISGSVNNKDAHPKVSPYNPDLIPAVSSSSNLTEPFFSSLSNIVDLIGILIVLTMSILLPLTLFIFAALFSIRKYRKNDRYPEKALISTEKPIVHKIGTAKKLKIPSGDISEVLVKPIQVIPPIKPLPIVKPIVTPDLDTLGDVTPSLSTPEIVTKNKKSLFSSIQYRVHKLIYEQGDNGELFVRIMPLSGSIKEIIAKFNNNKIVMEGCMEHRNLSMGDLEVITSNEPWQPLFEDPWQDIELIGDENSVKRIKSRREIADKLASLGTCKIKILSARKGKSCLQIMCNESTKAIDLAYSLIKDLQWFLEMHQY